MLAAVNRLSDAMVEQLARAGWAPLRTLPNGDTGRILLVDAHRLDQFMPPRCSMMPVRSKFSGRDNTRGPVRVAQNRNGYDAESKMAISEMAIHSDSMTFEVRCWGIANENEEDLSGRDWDYTIAIRDALIAAANEIANGCYQLTDGEWVNVAHVDRVGREFVFYMSIQFPITQRLLPANVTSGETNTNRFAPSDTHMAASDQMRIGTGASSPGCEG